MSSRKKEKTASKLDHKQEVFYPLDYSFKTLSIFEGIKTVPHDWVIDIIDYVRSLYYIYDWVKIYKAIYIVRYWLVHPTDIVMEKPRSREHQAVVSVEVI